MTILGTPLTPHATRVLLLGSGELGKEVAIELMRLGVEVIAVDRYPDAPAHQVAHRAHVIDMLDPVALRALIEREQPHLIVPEIEALATDVLLDVEEAGLATVIPTARAARLTMDREGIRRLAAEELGLPTSPYRFVDSAADLDKAVAELGTPCVVKPVMSSSGKGQSVVREPHGARAAWEYAMEAGRATRTRVIVEAFVEFDYEITQLTVRHVGGTALLEPIGHVQEDGDYRESWQPQPMSPAALARAQEIAGQITAALGGYGVFGVELFVRGDEVLFNEVSPRPHDTGLVTLASQRLSEFALHARAILGLPLPEAITAHPSASCAVLGEGDGIPVFGAIDQALAVPETDVRFFGKPRVEGRRRIAVTVARGDTVEIARDRARAAANALTVSLA
ncbi:formate-dependent phosphoribosylglycinamide formyltransferase [Demequina globuliformis]|uniref:formate-dependent phosphoribosylglycinamide formyltransferase n=1 Tax=Demequina globuliformis TaxID=676202 RepID=UPI0007821528|nr:formate-dependent phosphoribosylglycinamide formyltransferase [Demequina globuliformis]